MNLFFALFLFCFDFTQLLNFQAYSTKGLIFKTPTLYFIAFKARKQIERFNALKEGLRMGEYNIADLDLDFLLNFDWPFC